MQKKRVRTQLQGKRLVVITCLSGFISFAQISYSQTPADRTQPPSIEKQSHSQAQEALVQRLISGTLIQNETANRMPAPSSMLTQSNKQSGLSQSLPVGSHEVMTAPTFTAATTTMVTALAIVLSLLALAAYVIRRYVLKPNRFGPEELTLSVRARVMLNPKSAVTLLEVPGKLLIIGTSGSQLIPLGEVPIATDAALAPNEGSTEQSFSAALDEQRRTLQGDGLTSDPLLHMPEEIQRKVSRLKQL